MNNQLYTSDDDPDFHYCQQCGDLFMKHHDRNNSYCSHCITQEHLEYDYRDDHWYVDGRMIDGWQVYPSRSKK